VVCPILLRLMEKITVTIDTNCINVKQSIEALNKLEEWNKQGLITIFKTEIMDEELKGELRRLKAQKYPQDTGARVWNYTAFNPRHFGGEDPKKYPIHNLIDLIFPNWDKLPRESQIKSIRDVEHLATHYQYKRDYFVTMDKGFLSKRKMLKENYEIIILTPDECIKEIQHRLKTDSLKK